MIAFDPTVVAAPAPQEMFTGGMTEGLRTEEIHHRLIRFGPNVRPETCANRWKIAISKFWAPAPWMLELAIIFQVGLGIYGEAAVIGGLPLLNGILGVRQEGRAQASLDALQARPALTASARRDGTWRIVPAVDLVPGDIAKLSLGPVVAADMRSLEGEMLLDQSTLTGESLPVETDSGQRTYAGVLGMPVIEIIPLMLTVILAAIPVGLPATFTPATTLVRFTPFDTTRKMPEAEAEQPVGSLARIAKGACPVIPGLVGPDRALRVAGFVALSNPPRPESKALIDELQAIGVRTVIVAGNSVTTAAVVAHAVGSDGVVRLAASASEAAPPEGTAVFAGVNLAAADLAFCTSVPAVGKYHLGLDIDALRTLSVAPWTSAANRCCTSPMNEKESGFHAEVHG
ncbi:MAG: hypothetical protein B7Z80_00875 [Rhodospirillales bacterium 20-64-7]|nr:MAG: hypothetical protein B7Z80_00875 [Rhodospirillales bacterium 20-64-7]HQT75736.1 cation-transporting P-type ATPase [Rhodopila sp.]